jgi:magnesium-transporting ATPase (P-type)
LAFAPDDKEILNKPPRKTLTILDKVDFNYVFSLGALTTIFTVFSAFYKADVSIVFTTLIFVQQMILIDLFLSHKHIISNYRLLFKPIFQIAFWFPFLLHPLLLYHPLLQQVFKTTPIPLPVLSILFFYSSLILVGIRGVKEFLKI